MTPSDETVVDSTPIVIVIEPMPSAPDYAKRNPLADVRSYVVPKGAQDIYHLVLLAQDIRRLTEFLHRQLAEAGDRYGDAAAVQAAIESAYGAEVAASFAALIPGARKVVDDVAHEEIKAEIGELDAGR